MNEIQDPLPEKHDFEANQPTKKQWTIIAVIGLLALVGIITFLAGGFFTINSIMVTRNTQSVQTAAAATAVVIAKEHAIRASANWPLVLFESFNNNDNEWIEDDIDDEFAAISIAIKGVYSWEAKAKQGFVWWVWPNADPVTEFYLAVDAQNQGENSAAQYGLIFNFNEDTEEFHYLEIQDEQYFSLWAAEQDGWKEIIPATSSTAIIPGGMNHLEVIAIGEDHYILINDELVGETSMHASVDGYTGVAIGLSQEGDEGTIIFDNFELRAP